MKLLLRSKTKYSSKRKSWNGVPATVRKPLGEASLPESFFASILTHIIVGILIWAITFSIAFFGLAPKLFPTPKKMKDIEFIINGSKHSHGSKARKRKAAAAQSAPAKTVAEPVVKNVVNNVKQSSKSKSSKSSKKSKSSAVPDFSMEMPSLNSMSSGLGSSGRKGRSGSSGGSSATGSSWGSLDGDSSATGSGGSGFNKASTKKMVSSFDISPYVSELKRNIRWNWKAPKDADGKRVELFLRIAKDGRIVILNVKRTSEIGEVDNAALNAVRKCVPLSPLPSKYPKTYLDVVFTFSSNSVGSRY